MDAVTTLSTGAIELGEKPSVISAIAKYHLTEKMRDCINDAMDIHGGKGVFMGPSNYLARGYQGAPIAITVEGANILTRSLIIYGQGAIRCHPYVLAELAAANNNDEIKSVDDFDHALFGHIGFSISNIARSIWCSMTASHLVSTPFHDKTQRYYQQLTRFSANLAMLSDILMLALGADLKRKERISARLGDVLSQLYLASACLKRFNDDGRKEHDLPLLQWSVETSLYQCQQAIEALLNNFPNKWLAIILRAIIFPYGTWLTLPSDQLDQQVARILQTPSETRTRLGNGQYITRNDNNVFGLLEQTLENIIACEPVFAKVCAASNESHSFSQLDKIAELGLSINAITESEAQLLIRTEQGRKAVIAVDDFAQDQLAAK